MRTLKVEKFLIFTLKSVQIELITKTRHANDLPCLGKKKISANLSKLIMHMYCG